MKRFIAVGTEDYYSGGPSFSEGGFVGDFDRLPEAQAAASEKYNGLCSMYEILDQLTRNVFVWIEDKPVRSEKL